MENLELALDMAADYVRKTWISVVSGGMLTPPGAPQLKFDSKSQRDKYSDSIVLGDDISIPEASYFGRIVTATDPVAAETERGKDPWDMKPMLLGGRKARMSKDGNIYNVIPFRHGDSKGSVNSQFKAMPKDIHEMAKKLKASVAGKDGFTLWGQKLTGTEAKYPAQTKMIAVNRGGKVSFIRYKHKSGIYESMYRVEAPYAKTSQSKYITFRCVSEKSDPNSWWHPGRAGQPHIQWIIDYCQPRIEKLLMDAARADLVDMIHFGVGINLEFN